MDLTGSINQTLGPIFTSAYGSFIEEGGVGSSVLNGVLSFPLFAVNFVVDLVAITGQDLGSTLGV